MGSQQYSLRWNNYLRHITCAFDSLRSDKDLVDVTLSCDGQKVHAHKMLLSACSSYFRDLFKENPCQHPVIIFRNVRFEDLLALIDFMYQGEVNVEQEQLASFLNTAELLQVQGLTNSNAENNTMTDDSHTNTEPKLDIPPPEVQFEGDDRSPRFLREDSPISTRPSTSSAPAAKRRRWHNSSSSPVSVTPIVPGTDGGPDIGKRSCSPPVEITPMKMEAPEYLEDEEQGDREETTEDTLARLRDNDELLLTKSSSNQRLEPHSFGSGSVVHPMDILHTTDTEALATAGPSSDGHSQDGLQGLAPPSSHKLPPAQLIPIRQQKTPSLKNLIVSGAGDSFMCMVCGRAFKDRKSCHRHMSMHLGTSTCPICFSILSRVSHLKRHMKNVHGV